VLLVDSKARRYLITLVEGGSFSTHAGTLPHADLIGRDEGILVRTSHGARMRAVRPTLRDYILKMPRGAQVIYPKDIGPILVLADIFPGARLLEAGVGSGALSMAGGQERRVLPRPRPAVPGGDPRCLRGHR
jgi:tRNA (adenine57-N1/adenine58-N1)-methyltransferase